jgi:hypothetical protein
MCSKEIFELESSHSVNYNYFVGTRTEIVTVHNGTGTQKNSEPDDL